MLNSDLIGIIGLSILCVVFGILSVIEANKQNKLTLDISEAEMTLDLLLQDMATSEFESPDSIEY